MLTHRSRSDADLLEASSSDALCFGDFYRRYELRVLAYLRVRVRDPELAVDLAAETFARVLEHAGDFDRRLGGEDASGWLFTIAYNTMVSSLRRGRVADDARQRVGMLDAIELTDAAYDRIDALDEAQAVLPLLAGLPADQREALLARVVDEKPYDEIAAALQCSPLVVRKRVSRGLAALRNQLEATP
jgi:RNA polymerase sigma-70 factor (ECF subfamily)